MVWSVARMHEWTLWLCRARRVLFVWLSTCHATVARYSNLPLLLPTLKPLPPTCAAWWGLGPIFWEVGVNSIGGVCDVGDLASNQTWFKVLQPLQRCSIVRHVSWKPENNFGASKLYVCDIFLEFLRSGLNGEDVLVYVQNYVTFLL